MPGDLKLGHDQEAGRPRRKVPLIVLIVIVVVVGMLGAVAVPNFFVMQNRVKEGSTKANMHTVRLAAEDYWVTHNGIYAPDAEAFINLLPGSGRIANAFTGERTEPRTGAATAESPPGSVWYRPLRDTSGVVVNYLIEGAGWSGALTLVLTSHP